MKTKPAMVCLLPTLVLLTSFFILPQRAVAKLECVFDTNGDGKVDLKLADTDGDGFCEFPPGSKTLRGTLRITAATPVEIIGSTTISLDDFIIEEGGEVRSDGTIPSLKVQARKKITVNGTLDIDATKSIELRTTEGTLHLDGTTLLTAGERISLKARDGDLIIDGAILEARKEIVLETNGGDIILTNGARLKAGQRIKFVAKRRGNVRISGDAVLEAPKKDFSGVTGQVLPVVDLDGDGNHDGVVENTREDDDPEDTLPGIIVLNNLDDDNGNGTKDNQGGDAAKVQGNNDANDLAEIIIRRMQILPAGSSVVLTLHTPTNVDPGLPPAVAPVGAKDVVRIFSAKAAGADAIMGEGTAAPPTTFTLPANAANNVDLATLQVRDIHLGVEGLERAFAGEVKLKLELKNAAGNVVASDQIQLKVSPLILLHHLRDATTSYVSETTDPDSNDYCTVRFPGATPGGVTDKVIPGPGGIGMPTPLNGTTDPWAQDEFQIAYQQAPYKNMYVVLDSKRDRELNDFPISLLGPDFGHIQIEDRGVPANSLDSFGNLEVSPPTTVAGVRYPLGRIYYGDSTGLPGRAMDPYFVAFLKRQQVQSPVSLYSDWLRVGHVDEFMSIVRDPAGTHGWKVLIADPQLALNILDGKGGQPGVNKKLHIPRYTDFGVNTVGALIAHPVNTTATLRNNIWQYNLLEAHGILFGGLFNILLGHPVGGLKAQIQAAFGLVDADFISVPVLFDRFPGGRAEAITPGLANGAVYAGVYIAPDPFLHVFGAGAIEEDTNRNFMLDAGEDTNGDGLLDTLRDPFQVYVNGVLPAGVTAAYIDDWTTYHLGAGEVHCSSNEKRRIPAVKWWE